MGSCVRQKEELDRTACVQNKAVDRRQAIDAAIYIENKRAGKKRKA